MSDIDDRDENSPDHSQLINAYILEEILSSLNTKNEDRVQVDQMHANLLDSLESQIDILKGEIKHKDCEIELLLSEVKKRRDLEIIQHSETYDIGIQFEEIIRSLHERNEELEEGIEEVKTLNSKHLAVIEQLENENEKLRFENMKCSSELKSLKIEVNNGKLNPIDSTIPDFEFSTNCSVLADNHRCCEVSNREYYNENLWFNQLENMKEQLGNEKTKSRDLEFLIVNLRNSNQHLSIDNAKINEEKKSLEIKLDSLKADFDKMNECRMQDRLKIDSLIAFSNLLENCSYTGDETGQHLADLPSLIVKYLNGNVSSLSFNKPVDHQINSARVIKSAKLKQIVKRNAIQIFEPQTEELRVIYKNIGDIKETMVQMLQAMSKLGKAQADSTDKFALQNIECLQDYTPTSSEISLASIRRERTDTFFLSKAVKHSHSLLANIRKQTEAVVSDEDSESFD